MEAIAWDDLLKPRDKDFFNSLKTLLFEQGEINLTVTKDWADFKARVLTGKMTFALIDCFDGDNPDDAVGPDRAFEIRQLAMSKFKDWDDPEFPIFLISSAIDTIPLNDWERSDAVPIEKSSPELVLVKIKKYLQPRGRWVRKDTVFLIHRELNCSLSNQPIEENLPELIGGWCCAAGKTIVRIKQGDELTQTALDQVNDGILGAEKILAVLTRDEKLAGDGGNYHTRPNIYMELGMLGAGSSRYMLSKTMVCVQNGVQFPTNYGSVVPARFEESIEELKDEIDIFLRRD